jgi:uncharacterized membrane protein (DUF373 family)
LSDDRRTADRVLGLSEDVVYLFACLVLFAGAVALLVKSVHDLATGLDEGTTATAKSLLDTLLLVFVFVELQAAVRVTMTERALVAEPFLLVGIIASIKEIVVTSIDLSDAAGTDEFADLVTKVGVLTGLLLVLAVSSFLLRRKEREPAEHPASTD